MRITSGAFRGRRLFVPRGLTTRPTADRVKEAIFNILGPLPGLSVLDLFAGSGALGLEALSRGAKLAVLVDNHSLAVAAIKRNIETLGITNALVLKMDVSKGGSRLAEYAPFDLVFLDPPYGQNLAQMALTMVIRGHLASPEAVVVLEHSTRDNLEPLTSDWDLLQTRRYGQTAVSFFKPLDR